MKSCSTDSLCDKNFIVKWRGTNLSKISANEQQPLAVWTIIIIIIFLNIYPFSVFWKRDNVTWTENKLKNFLLFCTKLK